MAITRYSSFDVTVNTIADRNNISRKVNHMTVLVKDAIADINAGSGKAAYIWDSSDELWVLISRSTSDTINNATATALAGKVDKETGKQLTEENYTSAEKTKLANLTDNFKGGYNNATERDASLTVPQDNWYVIQFDTDTFWYYKHTIWTNTGNKSTGDMLKSIYDPTGINSDAFSMGNMVETLEKKIFTRLEREKLAGIEADAEKNKVNSVNGKAGTVILTKADFTDLDKVDNTADNEKIVKQAGKTTGALSINGEIFDGSVNKTIVVASSTAFATNAEVLAGTVSDKAVSPNTIANNYPTKTAVDTMITNLELAKVPITLEGLTELPSPKLGIEVLTASRHPVTGKPIYEKAIDFGTLPNNTTKNVAHNIDCEWIIIDYKSSYAYDTASTIVISVMNGVYNRMYVNDQNVSSITTSPSSSYRAIVVLRYTKTTDTAESPVRLVGNTDYIISPNGTKYKINVDNDGNLSTTQII